MKNEEMEPLAHDPDPVRRLDWVRLGTIDRRCGGIAYRLSPIEKLDPPSLEAAARRAVAFSFFFAQSVTSFD